MKLCRIEIVKRLTGDDCKNLYPTGYDPAEIDVFSYDEGVLIEGDNVGYCIAFVADGFTFTTDCVEITRTDADNFVAAAADETFTDTQDETDYIVARTTMMDDSGTV